MSNAPTETELAEFARNADELRGLLGKYGSAINSGASRAEIHVNANAPGVWLATTCCFAMLVGMVTGFMVGGFWLQREFTRTENDIKTLQDRMQTQQGYLNAIYRAAPSLQPKEQEKKP